MGARIRTLWNVRRVPPGVVVRPGAYRCARRRAPDVITTSCFIPAISALAAGDISDPKALYQPVTPDNSELDAFLAAGRNEGHTTMTEELGEWIVNEIVAVG